MKKSKTEEVKNKGCKSHGEFKAFNPKLKAPHLVPMFNKHNSLALKELMLTTIKLTRTTLTGPPSAKLQASPLIMKLIRWPNPKCSRPA
jgi:hypothetical protein